MGPWQMNTFGRRTPYRAVMAAIDGLIAVSFIEQEVIIEESAGY